MVGLSWLDRRIISKWNNEMLIKSADCKSTNFFEIDILSVVIDFVDNIFYSIFRFDYLGMNIIHEVIEILPIFQSIHYYFCSEQFGKPVYVIKARSQTFSSLKMSAWAFFRSNNFFFVGLRGILNVVVILYGKYYLFRSASRTVLKDTWAIWEFGQNSGKSTDTYLFDVKVLKNYRFSWILVKIRWLVENSFFFSFGH